MTHEARIAQEATHPDQPQIDRSIYPMPMFVLFPVPDPTTTAQFYHRLGFITLATIPGESGEVEVAHLRRLRYQDIVLVTGDPVAGSTRTTFAFHEEDLEEIARHVREDLPEGAEVEGPSDTPWFTTDLQVTDPHGNQIVLSSQRAAEAGQALDWSSGFGGDFESELIDEHRRRHRP